MSKRVSPCVSAHPVRSCLTLQYPGTHVGSTMFECIGFRFKPNEPIDKCPCIPSLNSHRGCWLDRDVGVPYGYSDTSGVGCCV